jgi:hypothetical protein
MARFCGKCRTEYVDEIRVCPECGNLLIAEGYAESDTQMKGQTNRRYIECCAVFGPGDIALVHSILQGYDIQYYTKGGDFTVIGGVTEPTYFMVDEDDADAAVNALATVRISGKNITLFSGSHVTDIADEPEPDE